MTKKDYAVLAEVIRTSTTFQSPAKKVVFINQLAAALHEQNPRFDVRVFHEACHYLGPVTPDMMEATPLNSQAVSRKKA